MDSPERTNLPFFAYGVFQPGQIGFLRLRPFVRDVVAATSPGVLLERDGLPMLVRDRPGEVKGSLIWFRDDSTTQAYSGICDLEPDAQYRWEMVASRSPGGGHSANALIARQPKRGTVSIDDEWNGQADALFTVGLDVVGKILEQHERFEWSLEPMFHLQAGYLLLWSAIERYLSLRYGLRGDPNQKVLRLAEEPSFARALRRLEVPEESKTRVFRADDPNIAYRLDCSDPKQSIQFYYQVRNNVAHRGKAVGVDFDLVRNSLRQLLPIFRLVLGEAFDASRWP